MSGIQQFSLDLDTFATQVKLAPALVAKRVAFSLFRRIVLKTPVDTGRARASWTISLHEPDLQVAAERPQGQTPGEAAAAEALGKLAALPPNGPTDVIWIANNLPYIRALEDGHSGQAPAGMAAISLLEEQQELNALIQATR